MATEKVRPVDIQVDDCVEGRGGMQKLAGRVSEFTEKDGVRYAVVWWTDGRNPTEELPEHLEKASDSECKRGKHPR